MTQDDQHLDAFEAFDRDDLGLRSEAVRAIMANFSAIIEQNLAEYQAYLDTDPSAWPEAIEKDALEHNQLFLHVLLAVMAALMDFGPTCYDFFYKGFFGDKRYISKSDIAPPRTVLGTVLHAMSEDFNIIQQSVLQRRLDRQATTPEHIVLATADRLGANIVHFAEANGILDTQYHLVSHLAPYSGIRLIPYFNAIFLALPYSSITSVALANVKDFLIIPHEIGHLAYWMGNSPDSDEEYICEYIDKRLDAEGIPDDDWRRNWVEELAADLFGLLVAGPVMALEFQYLMTDDTPNHFINDTSKHPIPVLRPIFLHALLRKIKEDNGDDRYEYAPDALDSNWRNWLERNRHVKNPFDPTTTFKIKNAPREMTTRKSSLN